MTDQTARPVIGSSLYDLPDFSAWYANGPIQEQIMNGHEYVFDGTRVEVGNRYSDRFVRQTNDGNLVLYIDRTQTDGFYIDVLDGGLQQ